MRTKTLGYGLIILTLSWLAACVPAFTIGGSVSGLGGAGLVLQNSGGDDLAIDANGKFTFKSPVATTDRSYAVTIKTQPIGQVCTVINGNGIATASVSNVSVQCAGVQVGSACQKADAIWNDKIVPTIYGGALPALTSPSLSDILQLGMASFTVKALSNGGDELELGRRKLVHAFGAEARFRFVASADAATSGYTGIYATGADCVIGRLSVATQPTASTSIPAVALKFFVDGDNPSVNLHLMYSIDGQDGHNFFEKEFSNIIPAPTTIGTSLLASFFHNAAVLFGAKDPTPSHLTVEHLAKVNVDSSSVSAPHAPFKLVLKPTAAASAFMLGATVDDDFRTKLADYPVGQAMYDVYALDVGDTADKAKLLGQLVTTSKIVASQYGDEKLYFQHNMQR